MWTLPPSDLMASKMRRSSDSLGTSSRQGVMLLPMVTGQSLEQSMNIMGRLPIVISAYIIRSFSSSWIGLFGSEGDSPKVIRFFASVWKILA